MPNRIALEVTTAAASKAVDIADVKNHLNISGAGEDSLLEGLIEGATAVVEAYLRRALINRTLTFWMDRFPVKPFPWWDGVREGALVEEQEQFIELPKPPLSSVTSVSTFDTGNNENVFSTANYFVDSATEPGRVILNFGQSWPTSLRSLSAVKVVYVAGYGTSPAAVPEGIKAAIMRLISLPFNERNPNVISEKVGQVSRQYRAASINENIAGEQLDGTSRMLLMPYRVIRLV